METPETGFLYAPNSIWHGTLLKGFKPSTLKSIEIERLKDFLDYLFEFSEHCDHITQSAAWKEFEQYEIRTYKPFN